MEARAPFVLSRYRRSTPITALAVVGPAAATHDTTVAAALATLSPGRVAVVALTETGGTDRLAAVRKRVPDVDTSELARHPEARMPRYAGASAGDGGLTLADAVRNVVDIQAVHDLTIVLGNGGLLTPYHVDSPWTIDELLADEDIPAVVVTTVADHDHTALTVQRLEENSLDLAGIVVVDWPEQPTVADVDVLAEYFRMGKDEPAAVLGAVPQREFRRWARAGFGPQFNGAFDVRRYLSRVSG